jgi:hypothetical protein
MKLCLALMAMILAAVVMCGQAGGAGSTPVSVGKLIYAGDHKTVCFNEAFVEMASRDSRVRVARKFEEVKLHDVKLFEHPMVVMSGTGEYALSEQEVNYLRQYLLHGGFLLASSKCQDAAWDGAFRKAMEQVLPDAKLEVVPVDHALMKVMFDIKAVETVRKYDKPLWGLTVEGRMVVLYSPVGLNDSAQLGLDCCCCGGNEIRNARWINANALVYAMTR